MKDRRLTDEEARKLQRLARRGEGQGKASVARYRRALVVLASARGNTVPVIARLVQTSEDRVREVIHNFNKMGMGCLDPKWAGGRPRRISPDDEAYIVETANARPGFARHLLHADLPAEPTAGVRAPLRSSGRVAAWVPRLGPVDRAVYLPRGNPTYHDTLRRARRREQTGCLEVAPLPELAIGEGCVSCGPSQPFATHVIDEGMFRTGESFTYHECLRCGSLQIAEVPTDLGRYYPKDKYYSLSPMKGYYITKPILQTRLARILLRVNTHLFLQGYDIPTTRKLADRLRWARLAGMKQHERILDIGCGAGELLLRMHVLGFKRLAGADPFLPDDRVVASNVPLWKLPHTEIPGHYDWVMLHHTFEHVSDPRSVLQSCRRLLMETGRVLIRMPIMGNAAWQRYRTNWVQIDPPRHLILYTPRSFRSLAEAEGFHVEDVFYDSSSFQFWGSECVTVGRPFAGGRRGFTNEQLALWEREAAELNEANDGDQGGFVLSVA